MSDIINTLNLKRTGSTPTGYDMRILQKPQRTPGNSFDLEMPRKVYLYRFVKSLYQLLIGLLDT